MSKLRLSAFLAICYSALLPSCTPHILTASASHQGWIQAMALGGRTPVAQAVGLATTQASVTLGWKPMIIPSANTISTTITSYNIYRATTPGGENFSAPLVTNISSATNTFTDTSVSPLTNYFYVVRPVAGGVEYATLDSDSEIKIMVPPVNMSLVHRWIANWEMCSNLMARPYDRNNNYRCEYVGPINNGGYYDIGQNSFWDTVGVGCNYTPTAGACSNVYGCIGNGVPSGSISATAIGQVYYDRSGQGCYYAAAIGSGSWQIASDGFGGGATDSELAAMSSNQPGLPPLVLIDQKHSQTVCQQFNVAGLGFKRLPKHSEQIVAAAWPPNYGDTLISSIENGINLPFTGYCNSNAGSGLLYSITLPLTNWDTLPATTNASVVLGSNATKNCLSLHGIQDMVGNVFQWSSDQLGNCSTVTHSCAAGGVGTIDLSNNDWYWAMGTMAINFDGIIGPGGTSAGQTSSSGGGVFGGYTTEWDFSSGANNATDFLPPIGLPLVGNAASSYDSLAIGTGNGQFNPNKFRTNHFWLYTDSGSVSRGACAGGDWLHGAETGRFTIYLAISPGNALSDVSARCLVTAGN